MKSFFRNLDGFTWGFIAAIAVVALMIVVSVCLQAVGMRLDERGTGTFKDCIQTLEHPRSDRNYNIATFNIIKMGPSVVPRLVAELGTITNKLSPHDIYTFSSGGWVEDENARPALFRAKFYYLISTLDANVYRYIVIESCRTNVPEICLALSGADCEKILGLPNEQLVNLTNTLNKAFTNSVTDPGTKLSIERFFQELEWERRYYPPQNTGLIN